ncbi:NAD dependent epimerase/dehydratase family protein [Beggiatoa alba B18LD]|uniref:NAD dependent epimerase/dehydratase family protein n=1 Tax=Beggiatoa alba B18LD TaxID=395493 RepID=I3CGR0_9GAMM|nr:NAD-dependent epimerase/dehydratase family protein [Beggiatoa alba]EIJ42803.1 NAD dependent epimerase/dehydratase family protein [Beggiatoa alba B18LD]
MNCNKLDNNMFPLIPAQTPVLVTGASNQIGHFLLPHLQQAGWQVTAISRQATTRPDWQQLDLQTAELSIYQPTVLIHIAPLSLLPVLLEKLPNNAPLQRLITFSSTSRFTKINSNNFKEQQIVTQLTQAEQAIINICLARQIPYTIFRPTLVYGCGLDKNISFIARFIQRFGFFPLIGSGVGLRQPVHADDLALACLQVLNNPTTFNKSYNLSGGETLSYRAMVEHVFTTLGKKPRILVIPEQIFYRLANLLRIFPMFRHVSGEMVSRMKTDLCFASTDAVQDFAYTPRAFTQSTLGILSQK